MGFKSSEWAYNVPNLTAPERAVLVALAHCRNDKTGACFPGQDTLVEMTGLSEKTVRRALAALDSREVPVISRTPRFAGRYRTSDSYELLFDNYRSQRPPVTVTTGQPHHRSLCPSPPVTVSLTTGHSDHPIEEEQEVEHEEEQEVSSSPSGRELETAFDRAWANWPKKVERKKSLAAFVKVAKPRGADVVVADIIRFGDAYAATTEHKHVPALCRWLDGERWDDELPTAGPRRQSAATRNAAAYREAFGITSLDPKDLKVSDFPPGHVPSEAEWGALMASVPEVPTPAPKPIRELPSRPAETFAFCDEHPKYPIIDDTCAECARLEVVGQHHKTRGAA